MFIVWKRSDNYVSVSKATSLGMWDGRNHAPKNMTFEVLGTFMDNDWEGAKKLAEAKRKEIPQPDWALEE